MIEYHIHRAGRADWETVRSVRLRSLADTPDAFATTLAQDEARSDDEWEARVENRDVAHFLALGAGDESFGLAVGAPYRGFELTAGLFGMWVAPEARGRRIGKALVEAVVDWARSEQFKRVVLDVAEGNSAAIRLYESCGFVATGNTSTLPPPREYIVEHEWELILE